MAVFKCKMCGGALEIQDGATIVECEYCGTKQTLPKLDDEKRANLYDRANHFRRNNEFDRAMGIYEQILNEDNSDAEAYWSLVLCRYGIEYVEDPVSHKRVPTVNRAQFTSIFADNDYQSALQHADYDQKSVYESEAKAIDEIQKGILAISQKEEPFDVFICYKETDNAGRRTPDSVLANDLYHQLTQEGFKVFFSRITLEDKLGSAYEPYIFAALNSAKVMVVLGTKPEYFNAVWVKNEWSRYLALIRNGAKKMIIPAYKDMDPYDLPEEFSHLQAQDLSRLGFMQDLIRGIKKITGMEDIKTSETKETVASGNNGAIAPLLKRAFMFLEDGDWNSANEYCEKVLDIDPECAEAYLGKLMAALRVAKKPELANCRLPFNTNRNYEKALRYGDKALISELEGYIKHINTRNKEEQQSEAYNEALRLMQAAKTEEEYKAAAGAFARIPNYKDSASLQKKCSELAEASRKDKVYAEAVSLAEKNTVTDYESACEKFEAISGWKDAEEQLQECRERIESLIKQEEERRAEQERKEYETKIAQEKKRKKNIKIAAIIISVICIAIGAVFIKTNIIVPNRQYDDAVALMESGQYEDAIDAFKALDGYKDSKEKIDDCTAGILNLKYEDAVSIFESKDYENAYKALDSLNGFKDSAELADLAFEKYKASLLKKAEVGDTVFLGVYGKKDIEWEVLDKKGNKLFIFSKYGLGSEPYNDERVDVTWETCTLRKWLNDDFLNSSFSEDEKAMIQTVEVSADKNPREKTDPGKATRDKVFLLSVKEFDKYLNDAEYYVCTNYKGEEYWGWSLRTPGSKQHCYTIVNRNGAGMSEFVDVQLYGVRPAMWIELEQ